MSYYIKIVFAIAAIILLQFVTSVKAQPPSTPVSTMATTDGVVHAVVRSGNTIYIAGNFGLVRNPDNSFELRSKIAAIDLVTGRVTSWNPGSDGPILTIGLSGTTLYVGGQFTIIGGKFRNNIASLDINTDTYNATDWNPNTDGLVSHMIISGTTIYVSGDFYNIGGAVRIKLAALTTMTNSNNALSWNPQPDGEIFDMLLNGTNLYACGSFSNIGGKARNNIACVSTTSDVNNATDWDPNADSYVSAISNMGYTMYAVGNFTTIGGQPRVRIAALNMLTNTNNATQWNPDVDGRISTVKAFDNRVYIGGSFSNAGGQTRNYVASLDALVNKNNATSWNPILDDIVEKINILDSAIYVSGNFTTVNGYPKTCLAVFKAVTPTLTTITPANITINSAQSGGIITADGGPPVTARGVCWSLIANPTVDDSKTINGTGSGTFTSPITGLDIYTLYHVRAYATNLLGTSYGNDISFNTLPAIYTGNILKDQFCAGDSVRIPFTATPGFENDNYFIAQLSDSLGTFQNPVKLDSIKGKESGEIHTKIPLSTTYSINYRFRVVSSQAGTSLTNNGADIQINVLPTVNMNPLSSLCVDHPVMDLTEGSPPGGTYSGKGVSNNSFDAGIAGVGSHTLTYTYSDGFGCANRASATITVNPLPEVQLSLQTDICIDAHPLILVGGTPTGGTYSGTAVTGSSFDPITAGIGNHTITYTFTDSNGCTNSASKDIRVNPLPIVTLSAYDDVCLNTPAFDLTGGLPIGGNYTGTGVTDNKFNPDIAGVGTHIIQYTFTDSLGCTDSATKTIIVKPMPPKPVITQVDSRKITSSSADSNQWYKNGVIIVGATGKDLSLSETGYYSVQVTGTNGCVSEMSDSFYFHSLAVRDENAQFNISVYPNPAGDYIFINILNALPELVNLYLSDMLGTKVYEITLREITGNQIQKINTDNFSAGVYLLVATQGERKLITKIIINRNFLSP